MYLTNSLLGCYQFPVSLAIAPSPIFATTTFMESSSSRKPLHAHKPKPTRKKPSPNQIQSAIRGKTCPICLTHIHKRTAAVITACLHAYCIDCIRKWSDLKRKCPLCKLEFDSWFFKIDPYSPTFLEEKLPALGEGRKVASEGLRRRRIHSLAGQWYDFEQLVG